MYKHIQLSFLSLISERTINKIKIIQGFTLLELLLVLAIISALAGLVIFNLRPSDTLQKSQKTRELSDGKSINQALNTFIIDNSGQPPTTLSGLPSGNYPICKSGINCGGISLDELVPNYIITIPFLENRKFIGETGYKVIINNDSKISIQSENGIYTRTSPPLIAQIGGTSQNCNVTPDVNFPEKSPAGVCIVTFTLRNDSGFTLSIRYYEVTNINSHKWILNAYPAPAQIGSIVNKITTVAPGETFNPQFRVGLMTVDAYSLNFRVFRLE